MDCALALWAWALEVFVEILGHSYQCQVCESFAESCMDLGLCCRGWVPAGLLVGFFWQWPRGWTCSSREEAEKQLSFFDPKFGCDSHNSSWVQCCCIVLAGLPEQHITRFRHSRSVHILLVTLLVLYPWQFWDAIICEWYIHIYNEYICLFFIHIYINTINQNVPVLPHIYNISKSQVVQSQRIIERWSRNEQQKQHVSLIQV